MIEMTCRCTQCGVDQSAAWGSEFNKWFRAELEKIERERLELNVNRERFRGEKHKVLARMQSEVDSAQRTAQLALEERDRAINAQMQAQAQQRKAEREVDAAVKDARKREDQAKRLLRGLWTGKIDPYELLIKISRVTDSDRSELDPTPRLDEPVHGELLW